MNWNHVVLYNRDNISNDEERYTHKKYEIS